MSNQEKLIDIHRFFPKEEIGDGMFSVVFRIEDKETKEVFAAKVLNAPINPSQKEDMISFSREVNYNSGMNHPCVLKFIGYSSTNFNGDPNPVIITEYCKNKSLMTYIKSPELYKDVWNDTKKLISIYGIASGMKYLHENKIIHRDLKPENILMDDYLCPKIADFGLSKKIDHTGKTMSIEISSKNAKGTPIYMAPEIFKTYTSTFESDVYAFGILLYEIVTNTIPFDGLDAINLIMKLFNGSRPLFETPIVDSYRNLIERCWDQEPKNRPTFAEIVDELSQNQGFITDDVDEEDYRSYIKFIEGYQSSFKESKIVKLQDYIQSGSKTFREIDIKRYVQREESHPCMRFFFSKRKKNYIQQKNF